MNYLKEAIEDTRDHYILSNDPDARIGHKTTNTSFFGYKTHLAMTEERIITGAVVTSGEKDDGFSFNKDAGMYVCPAGHISIRRAKHGKKIKSSNPYDAYYFDVDTCKVCQLKEGCYKEGAKTKSYNISIQTPEQQEQMIFQESDYFKRKAKERYKIEAKNAELKNRYGYDKAESLGIIRMQMQGAMTIFAANVKRILKLING